MKRRITPLAYRDFGGSGALPPPLALTRDIETLSSRFDGPGDYFGLELRAQHHIDANFPPLPGRPVYIRPASEPLLLSAFGHFRAGWRSVDLLKMASIILGFAAQERTERMQGICTDGNRVEFEPASIAGQCLTDLEAIDLAPAFAVDRAAAHYARIIFAHPLRDGNGRLARSAIYGALLREGLLDKPILSLNAVFNLYKDEIADAVVDLGSSGNWQKFLLYFRDLMSRSVAIGLRIAPAARNISGPPSR